MVKSSTLGFILVAIGGAAVGFLAAQIIPLQGQADEETPVEQAEDTAQRPYR